MLAGNIQEKHLLSAWNSLFQCMTALSAVPCHTETPLEFAFLKCP